MKQKMTNDEALAAADALLRLEPKFAESWLGRLGRRLRDGRQYTAADSGIVSPDTEPKWFDPASPGWSVMHPTKNSLDP